MIVWDAFLEKGVTRDFTGKNSDESYLCRVCYFNISIPIANIAGLFKRNRNRLKNRPKDRGIWLIRIRDLAGCDKVEHIAPKTDRTKLPRNCGLVIHRAKRNSASPLAKPLDRFDATRNFRIADFLFKLPEPPVELLRIFLRDMRPEICLYALFESRISTKRSIFMALIPPVNSFTRQTHFLGHRGENFRIAREQVKHNAVEIQN